MADLQLVVAAVTGQFEKFVADAQNKVATAATGAINEAAAIIKREGRDNIAAAGFSKRWQNTFKVNVYPDKGKTVSMHAALVAWHKIPYAGIFEEGGTISGSPLLWLPLPGVPKSINGKHMSPKNFERFVGKLFRYKTGTTRIPLLGSYVPIGSRGGQKITVASLKRGATLAKSPGAKVAAVPVFFGISSVHINKRFDLKALFNRVNGQLASLYLKNFKP